MQRPLNEFAEFICELSGYDKFMPSSTGVEATEAAVKAARRWGYNVKGVEHDKAAVIFPRNGFWGRSITATGASHDPKLYEGFGPYTPGFPLIDYNDLDALERKLQEDQNIVGYMMEPIQGKYGVNIPDEGHMVKAKQICEKYNVLLMADEVMLGFGRSGYLYGH